MAATEFKDVKGFLPMEEAEKLRQWAVLGAQVGPLLEIGSYCGLSTPVSYTHLRAHET